jgi:hypothetical protein
LEVDSGNIAVQTGSPPLPWQRGSTDELFDRVTRAPGADWYPAIVTTWHNFALKPICLGAKFPSPAVKYTMTGYPGISYRSERKGGVPSLTQDFQAFVPATC